MAKTSSIQYCTERQLKDVYPGISSYDSKMKLYGFTLQESGEGYACGPYLSPNSGLVTSLYRDNHDLGSGKQTIGTTKITDANELIDTTETEVTVIDGSACIAESYIKIDDEIMYISNISSHTLTVIRGRLGTSASTHVDGSDVFQHFFPSADGQWLYDSDNDFLIISASNNPSDNNMETGEDWSTLKTRVLKQSSRMVESLIDSRMAREICKDREGNYPEFIIRATALKGICLLMKSHDPENPVIESFESEFNEIIDGYRSGHITLPSAVTMDSSKGVIRTVNQGNSSDLFPVELRGEYNGSGYELLKIVIESGNNGIIGTAKMTVYAKNDTSLKVYKTIDDEIITGDFQSLGVGSLQVRWSGDNVITAVCETNDEYEVELHGSSMSSTMSKQGSIRMSRRYG